jgi:hypothetical protein
MVTESSKSLTLYKGNDYFLRLNLSTKREVLINGTVKYDMSVLFRSFVSLDQDPEHVERPTGCSPLPHLREA